ncbi:hypothetical protein [Streptomyces sp. NBC_00439]|uniref:hypothetical protein n=1 Tax=Streptomyces sp. NBC_00439 TaxID=2903650 RepID=UPI002259718B|nr:hypothetical protein [Streptomyces sp. NBC_00439]MCX5100873.1 hypothetical protein [Streptomyces sp. NBC_00439]
MRYRTSMTAAASGGGIVTACGVLGESIRSYSKGIAQNLVRTHQHRQARVLLTLSTLQVLHPPAGLTHQPAKVLLKHAGRTGHTEYEEVARNRLVATMRQPGAS